MLYPGFDMGLISISCRGNDACFMTHTKNMASRRNLLQGLQFSICALSMVWASSRSACLASPCHVYHWWNGNGVFENGGYMGILYQMAMLLRKIKLETIGCGWCRTVFSDKPKCKRCVATGWPPVVIPQFRQAAAVVPPPFHPPGPGQSSNGLWESPRCKGWIDMDRYG